jgi:hypothetical protein
VIDANSAVASGTTAVVDDPSSIGALATSVGDMEMQIQVPPIDLTGYAPLQIDYNYQFTILCPWSGYTYTDGSQVFAGRLQWPSLSYRKTIQAPGFVASHFAGGCYIWSSVHPPNRSMWVEHDAEYLLDLGDEYEPPLPDAESFRLFVDWSASPL